MALDEALMAAAREGRITLRFYRWDPPCLSFGRHQRAHGAYDGTAAAARGIDVVRRPTGGRAVYHHRELTYAVVAPAAAWGGLRASYTRFNRALARGLRELGVPATLEAPGGGTPAPLARACFRDPVAGEVSVEGRKLVGSAQWREAGALLQHGSLLLRDEQEVLESLRTGVPAGMSAAAAAAPGESDRPSADRVPSRDARIPRGHADPEGHLPPGAAAGAPAAAIGLAEVLDPLPPGAELVEALAAGFSGELGLPVEPGEPSAAERRAAAGLERRYRDPAWTWRR